MALLAELAASSPQKTASTQDGDEKIWSQILEDASSESARLQQGSVVILGAEGSGKSSLVARMVNADRTPCASVLEYNYMTVHANEDNRQTYQLTSAATTTLGGQDSTNLPMWIMGGNETHAELLEYALPKQLAKCLLVLCASFADPARLTEQLQKWYKVAESQIQKHYSEEAISQARTEQLKAWQDYVEPAGSVYADAIKDDFRPEFVELESGVLTEACGATVIVVVTKTDEKPVMAATDMQRLLYQLRKWCLAHGAALVYTSAKNDINTQLLRKYIAHRIFGVAFTRTAHIVDETTVFIPAGWDSEKKVDIERDTLTAADTPLPANEEATVSAREAPIECQSDQAFLAILMGKLSENPSSPKRDRESNVTPASLPNTGSPLATFFGGLTSKKKPASHTPPALAAPSTSAQAATAASATTAAAASDPAIHFQRLINGRAAEAPSAPLPQPPPQPQFDDNETPKSNGAA